MFTVFVLPFIDTVADSVSERQGVGHHIAKACRIGETVVQIEFAVLKEAGTVVG